MAAPEKAPAVQPGPGEKCASLMVYTDTALCLGEIIVKEVIRVSTWLRTNTAPDHLRLYRARYMALSGGNNRPVIFPELMISSARVLAYHLAPPAHDPLDYDPSEPNRKMEPVTTLVGDFRMDGAIRMASISSLSHYLDVNRETYTGLYDVEITNMHFPALGVIHAPFVLIRQSSAIFATR